MITDAEWKEAYDYLHLMIGLYQGIGSVGRFGLNILLPLKLRYEQGERTRDLYDAIMEVE